ncbi:MAG: hypothetical protein P8Z50_04085 [candidate division WOR-3 bacterium]
MLKFKKQYLPRLFISALLLVSFIISCKTAERGWRYKVGDPYHEDNYHYEYAHISYTMNIKLTAKDSASNTYIRLKIITPLDSMKIYPALAYIKSPHFVDTVHFPIDAEYTIEDSIFHKINEDEISNPYFLNKDEKLLVNLIFKSFATYVKSFNSKPISEESDFILYYDIYNNKQPLTFHFIPDIDTTKNQ